MRRRWVVAAVAAAVLLVASTVLIAVRSGGGGSPDAVPRVPGYDPPRRFDPAAAVNLPREADADPPPVALHAFDAYVALPGRLQVVDTRSGTVRAEVTPAAQGAVGSVPKAPVVAALGGRAVVVAAFVVTVPGHGTTVAHDAVEIVVLDRDGLERLPGARVDLPPTLGDEGRLRAAWTIGAVGDAVVVVAERGSEREPVTYAVAVPGGAVRWRAQGFAAAFLAGGNVVGAQRASDGSRVRALGVADAGERWTAGADDESVVVSRGGPSLAAAVSVAAGSGQRALAFYDVATGRPETRQALPGPVTCRYDDRLVTVCWNAEASRPWATGFDGTTARPLWALPDAAAGRVSPQVTTVWHGTVYGTTENGPVLLDARSGADVPGAGPGIAPDLVNDVVGVVGATIDRPRARAYRAVG